MHAPAGQHGISSTNAVVSNAFCSQKNNLLVRCCVAERDKSLNFHTTRLFGGLYFVSVGCMCHCELGLDEGSPANQTRLPQKVEEKDKVALD